MPRRWTLIPNFSQVLLSPHLVACQTRWTWGKVWTWTLLSPWSSSIPNRQLVDKGCKSLEQESSPLRLSELEDEEQAAANGVHPSYH